MSNLPQGNIDDPAAEERFGLCKLHRVKGAELPVTRPATHRGADTVIPRFFASSTMPLA